MSWQLASFSLLALVLIGGAVWFERSRPASQLVAAVAALAALSIAGRVALSPVPNVVPTTDITLIAGYVLGGPAGFAVGALSALVSNVWLGQGPWTPWQMAGWGLVGLFGALLAATTGRRLGRLPLAAACAFAGIAYGALLDFSLMVTYGGEQSLDRFLALSARGVPFNVAHAAGNFALALAAGPALVRMLRRYRSRFEFAWRRPARPRLAAGAAAALLVAAIAASALPAIASAAGGGSAASWLLRAQNADGGFGRGPGEESSPGMTGWAVLGLEAAGQNPLAVRSSSGRTPIAYLRGTVSEITTTGDIERTILVLSAAGLDPRDFEGRDLVARLLARRGADGSWGRQVNPTAFGVLALAAAGHKGGQSRSAAWLRSARNRDGGWGFVPGASSDADSTGAALQALAAAGGSSRALRDGVAYLRATQGPGGGFTLQGGPVNAQSTAWAVQGLIAAGVAPSSLRRGGRSPLDYLASVRAGDGHYRYSRSSDQTPVWVTGQALQAVSGRALPLPSSPRPAAAQPAGGGSAAPGAATSAGAGAAPAAGGGAREKKKGAVASQRAGGAAAAAAAAPGPETPLVPLERLGESTGEDDGEDGGGAGAWLLAAIAAAGLAAAGGWWLRRRRRSA